ncbi:MAG TPA: hypothetical protein HA326_07150 [Thermoplasmata archaeon]|nr:hypothetical protein [Thermoplasmata archaeon]
MPPPQPYPGMYYQPMAPEHWLSRRNVWTVNALGLVMIWLGMLFRLLSTADTTVLAAARFFVISGALVGALASTAGALGSKKTTDMQNLGLLVWAGFLISLAGFVLAGFV